MTDPTHKTVTGVTSRPGPAGPESPLLRWLLLGWAAVHAVFAAGCYAVGVPLFGLGPHRVPAVLNWFAVAVAVLAAGAALAASRARPGGRSVLRRALWVLAGLSLVSGFSLLMDVIALLTGALPDSLPATAHHALGLLGALVLAANARTGRVSSAVPSISAAGEGGPSRRVRLAVRAGVIAFLPYATMKTIWATGGTYAGVSGAEVLAASRRNGASGLWLALEARGLDPTALLAVLGCLLLFALIRPWGQVFPRRSPFLAGRPVPRWLLLTPALIGAATLLPYGLLGGGYLVLASFGALELAAGDFGPGADGLLVSWTGLVGFSGYGVALVVATRSYWLRTRTRTRARTGIRTVAR
ncbi:hypothetical protein ACH4SP_19480 [Streptomyces sp. NPDC021093]|uniref:hypothetical protein n=1 Tax=Streptomyces sp. NPDC021093 TaxID=3365112 RepID=UPI00378CE1A3